MEDDFDNFRPPPVTEEDVVFNSKLDHLYSHDFGKGRYFQVVVKSEQETNIQLSPRIMLKIIYIKDNNDIEGLELIKYNGKNERERLKLSKFNLGQLRVFLQFIDSIDLKGIDERRIKLSDDTLDVLDEETKKKIVTLLSGNEGGEIVCELLKQGLITDQDLVNTGYRKKQLALFDNLLNNDGLQDYKDKIGKPNTKDETAWQYFFEKNEWIFGYGLDYRFQGILQKEFHASNTTASGNEGVISDYLLGDKLFTTFVELKLPSTPLFSKSKNRAKSWKLSNKLIGAYSQILEQKASGQIKMETKELFDSFNNEITQKSCDSRTILIIGSWCEVLEDPDGIKNIKEKTFELFRRDSRNIDIITYDELYDRAVFIVHNQKPLKHS